MLRCRICAGDHALDFRVAAVGVLEKDVPGQNRSVGLDADIHAENLIVLQARETGVEHTLAERKNVDVLSTFKEYVAVAFVSVKVLLDALMFPTWPTTSSAPTGGAPSPAGVNGVTVVPALKSAPSDAVSKLSRLTSIRSPVVLEEAIENAVRGTVVDRLP